MIDLDFLQSLIKAIDESSLDNIEMMCPTHNGYLAERDYGKEVLDRYRGSGRAREPAPVYASATV